jgi:TRAP-type mannitol/chloroaromatic compound transport system substrate-binding protein
MQTAFNPALPGSGEGVRIFTRTVKHMSGGALAIKILEPGRVAPTADMLDAVIAGDLEAAFTWSGYSAAKAPVFGVFATVPFGPGPEDMTSWMLEGDGSRIHRDAYDKLGVTGIPCGIQGAKGGGWFRGDLNTVADFKGQRLRFDGPGSYRQQAAPDGRQAPPLGAVRTACSSNRPIHCGSVRDLLPAFSWIDR